MGKVINKSFPKNIFTYSMSMLIPKLIDRFRELPFTIKVTIVFIVGFPITVISNVINLILMVIPTSYLHKDITGKVILITGGASGIGRAIAVGLAKKGAKIVSLDMNEEGNEGTARIIKQNGGDCFTYTVDISNREMVYSTANIIKSSIGSVAILINNAGISGCKENVTHSKDNSFIKTMDVNFFSHVWGVNAFLPDMVESNSGHIVSISSLSGITAHHYIEYSTSKFAVCGFIESLRNHLEVIGQSGIVVSLICPSYIDTPLLTEEFGDMPKMTLEYAAEQIIDGILREKEFFIIPKSGKIAPLLKALSPTFLMTKGTSLLFWSKKMKKD